MKRAVLEVITFDCCRKRNRDRYGIWKMQAGICVMLYLFTVHIALSLIQFFCLLK